MISSGSIFFLKYQEPVITFADIEQMKYDISCETGRITALYHHHGRDLYGNFYAPGLLYIYPDDSDMYNWERNQNGILWAAMLRHDLASAFDGRE